MVKRSRKKKNNEGKAKVKKIPFEFVLDELSTLDVYTRPMFGCTAIYLGEKIILILRDKETELQDNGVWLATDKEHHQSLATIFPEMRSIQLLADGEVTAWQNIPKESSKFEASVLKACELVLQQDERIGRIPKRRSQKKKLPAAQIKKASK